MKRYIRILVFLSGIIFINNLTAAHFHKVYWSGSGPSKPSACFSLMKLNGSLLEYSSNIVPSEESSVFDLEDRNNSKDKVKASFDLVSFLNLHHTSTEPQGKKSTSLARNTSSKHLFRLNRSLRL